MKLQNLNFFEKHVEKLAVGLGGAVLLIVGGYYVLGSPFGAEIGGRQATSPSEIEEPIQEAARQLQSRLEADTPFIGTAGEGDNPWQVPDYEQHFVDAQQNTEQSESDLALTFGPSGLQQDMLPPLPEQPYEVPRPPLATNLQAYNDYAQLPEEVVQSLPERVRSRFGDGPPYDLHYVSVSGEFDLQGWLAAFENVPEDRRIPEAWRLPFISAVYLQRQTQNPDTGAWEDTTRIGPLPVQIAYLPDSEREWTPEEARNAKRHIIQRQTDIRRPLFYNLKNRSWRPPSAMEEGAGNFVPTPDNLDQAQRQLRNLRQVENLLDQVDTMLDRRALPEAQLSRLERRWIQTWQRYLETDDVFDGVPQMPQIPVVDEDEDTQRRVEQQRRDDPRVGRRPGQDRRGQQGRRQQPPQGGRDEPQVGEATGPGPSQILSELEGEGTDARRRFAAPGQRGRGADGEEDGIEWQLSDPDNPESIRVWAHDTSAEPGRTYRYRLVVAVLNPLFQRRAVPPEQREANYDKIALAPRPSPTEADGWSTPVRLAPALRFFMVGARPQDRQATIQAWRLQGGRWHAGSFTQQAGDPMGGTATFVKLQRGEADEGAQRQTSGDQQWATTEQPIDMRLGSTLVDVVESAGQGLGDNIQTMIYRPAERNTLLDRELERDQSAPIRLGLELESANLRQALAKLYLKAQQKRQQREAEEEGGQGSFGGFGARGGN